MSAFLVLIIVSLIVGLLLRGLVLKLCARIVGIGINFKRALWITILDILLAGLLIIVTASIIVSRSQIETLVMAIVGGLVSTTFVFKMLQKSSWMKALGVAMLQYLFTLILLVGSALPLRLYVVEAFKIGSASMAPTLKPGDHIFVKKYDRHPARGDIVLFKRPGQEAYVYIMRVVGLPGENIEIHDGSVWANGAKLEDAPEVHGATNPNPGEVAAFHLGQDEYFMLGDNRERSFDSRAFGGIPAKDIVGTYWWTFFKSE